MAMAMNPIQVLRGGAEEEKEMILILKNINNNIIYFNKIIFKLKLKS